MVTPFWSRFKLIFTEQHIEPQRCKKLTWGQLPIRILAWISLTAKPPLLIQYASPSFHCLKNIKWEPPPLSIVTGMRIDNTPKCLLPGPQWVLRKKSHSFQLLLKCITACGWVFWSSLLPWRRFLPVTVVSPSLVEGLCKCPTDRRKQASLFLVY